MAAIRKAKKKVLQLEYDLSLVPEGGSLALKSIGTFDKTSRFEPAGHSFHERILKASGGSSEGNEGDEEVEAESAEVESPAIDTSFAWESGKTKKKSKDGVQEQDHYALIGLAHLRYLATEDQIRKAYRDAALKFHPDKMQAALMEVKSDEERAKKKESIETKFKSVQAAYEILMDPVKRRNFDSMDEFDDYVPTDCPPEDFFKVFGPVFHRNGKWSSVQPCLMPGDMDTPMEDVDKFYDFWWGFKSWREFPNEDEHDLESAEGRDHKRWMERQNNKLREKAKKEEVSRVRSLVENAFRRDPRLQRRKEEEKKEKQRKKELKNAAKKAAEEEEKREAEQAKKQEEEEQKRAAEEAALLKKQREKEKKLLRKEKARLRTIANDCIAGAPIGKPRQPWGVPEEDIETLCQSLEIEQLQALCCRLEELLEPGRRALTLRCWLSVVETSGKFEGNVPEGNSESESKLDEEFAAYLRDGGSTGASESQENGAESSDSSQKVPEVNRVANGASNGVVNGAPNGKVKELKQKKVESPRNAAKVKGSEKPSSPKPAPKPWSKEEVELLKKAVTKFPKGTMQRWEVISDYVGTGRTVDEVSRAVKTELLKKPEDSNAYESFLEKRKPPKAIPSPLSTRGEVTPATQQGTAGSGQGGAAAAEKPRAAEADKPKAAEGGSGSGPAEGEGSGWSEVQERALIKAVKTFPKDTDKRWERIAAAIPDKSKAQCMRKYNSMKQSFRSSKGGS